MQSEAAYEARHVKRRRRRTKAEMETFRTAILAIVQDEHPVTCRRVFYLAVGLKLVEKTEAGCSAVERTLIQLRRDGTLPYDWIVDATRSIATPRTWDSPADAISFVSEIYRRDPWSNQPERVMILLEKMGLHEAARAVTWPRCVPLVTVKGYSSLSLLYDAAQLIQTADVPWHVMHFGDWDPSGENIGQSARDTLTEMAPSAEIHFERRAVTPEQIVEWNLPTRPTKQTDTRSKNFEGESVELDTLPIRRLQELIEDAITEHVDQDAWGEHVSQEEQEKRELTELCDRGGG